MAVYTGDNNPNNYTGTIEDDYIYGRGGDDHLWGNAGIDRVFGESGNDYLYGDAGNDYLYGGTGNDVLDGGTGADYMEGGAGNDTYYVDSASDDVYEASGAGTDKIIATVSDTLNSNVENLYLSGSAATSGTGNALDNSIYGTAYDNSLYGKAGSDSLYGKAGNDVLDGGTGNDYLTGGTGNDTYYVDSASDVVFEASGEGTDKVIATVSYTLASNVENLYLSGSAATSGTGNALNNSIYGNSYANTLNGGAGDDYLAGGTGNDTYYVDSASDVVYEASGAGTDKVIATASYTLASNVENLYLSGSAATSGTGNALDNSIYGNSYANTLAGLAGNDSLSGGTGSDSFVFSESGAANYDTINDFSHDQNDTIVLKDFLDGVSDGSIEGLTFTGNVLDAALYHEGAGVTGNGAEDSGIYYDTETGNLWYNPTSGDAGDSVQICTLVGTPGTYASLLDASDITYSA